MQAVVMAFGFVLVPEPISADRAFKLFLRLMNSMGGLYQKLPGHGAVAFRRSAGGTRRRHDRKQLTSTPQDFRTSLAFSDSIRRRRTLELETARIRSSEVVD